MHQGCCGGLRRRALLRSGAALAATLPLAGCDAAVPDWLADLLVPEAMAAELGAQAFREILRETPPVRDTGLQRRVAGVGERIVAASRSSWPSWQFVVLDSPSRNAFALPGGKVGIFTGMLQTMASVGLQSFLPSALNSGLDIALERHDAPLVRMADVALAHASGYVAALGDLLTREVDTDIVVEDSRHLREAVARERTR